MNDRLKYRIWHIPTKTMHYNDFVITSTGYAAKLYQEDNYIMKFNQADLAFDKECIVMQCTGLKDHNGKLIYEGDIVKDVGYKLNAIYKVGFKKGAFFSENDYFIIYFHEVRKCFSESRLEIIGNIYTTPELLEE